MNGHVRICVARTSSRLFATFVVLSLLVTYGLGQSVLWTETWEGDPGLAWQVQGGSWEWGSPTSGPGSAHTGQNCAATGLAGNYTEPVDAYLVRRDSFAVPPAGQNPRLRIWHWYSFSNGDTGWVEVRQAGTQSWQRIGGPFVNTGCAAWTYPRISLSQFSSRNIYLRFYFKSRQIGTFGDVSSGWYIDEIAVVAGSYAQFSEEGWESGIGDWYVDKGVWEVGSPSAGPGSAFAGQNCAGTVLGGNYCEPADSRLISPPFSVPSQLENPSFRFWHWFSFANGDTGWVQARLIGTTNWQTIGGPYVNTGCGVWTYPLLSLGGFASSTIELAFYIKARQIGTFGDVSQGWYVDEVRMTTGPHVLLNPEGWENGIGDWYVDSGVWQVGRPTGGGPGGAYCGIYCAGTVIGGNYCEPSTTRMTSPWFKIVPPLRVRYWQWYSLAIGDTGIVQFRTKSSQWQELDRILGSGGNVWSQPAYILTGFADSTIQLGFLFKSRQIGTFGDVSSGWYIDSLLVETPLIISVGSPATVTGEFSLSQNYPNPFNPKTIIRFTLPVASDVSMRVFDLLGREVAVLVSERKNAGTYEVEFDAKDLASGVYLYRLLVGRFTETRKLLLLR